MIAYKVTFQVGDNNEWYQTDKYLVAKKIKIFKAHQISIIEDEETVEAMKQIISEDHGNQSFVALETNLRVLNSTLSK